MIDPGSTPLPLYLGPDLPRWRPQSAADVQAAINDGTLRERRWLDVKAQMGDTPGAKAESARDLASFANAGGALIVGVAEDKKANMLTVDAVDLRGLPEKVDQIARSRCDPPLYVICHTLLTDPADSTTGILLIEIPPSPSAPHMVDGRYYGRSDSTRYQLNDTDVDRLHAVRSARQLSGEDLIRREVARDPVPSELRENSHLHVIAQPLASPPDLVSHLIGTQRIRGLIEVTKAAVPAAEQFPPHLGFLSAEEPRATGAGFRSYGLFGRQFVSGMQDATEDGLIDLEVSDNGRITLFSGRGSKWNANRNAHLVMEQSVGVLTRCVVTLAGEVGRAAGYGGQWLLAVGLTDLRGRHSAALLQSAYITDWPPFDADEYIQTTHAGTTELLDKPGAVTQRLLFRLRRALGTLNYQGNIFAD